MKDQRLPRALSVDDDRLVGVRRPRGGPRPGEELRVLVVPSRSLWQQANGSTERGPEGPRIDRRIRGPEV